MGLHLPHWFSDGSILDDRSSDRTPVAKSHVYLVLVLMDVVVARGHLVGLVV